MQARRGTTLIEIVIVLAAVAILTAALLPRLAGPLDALGAESAAIRIAGAHARARLYALSGSRVTLVSVAADSLVIRSVDGIDTSIVWSDPGPLADRVTLAGPVTPVAFAPTGWTLGLANRTYRLVRGAAHRDVVISRLGRVRIVR